MRAVAWSVVSVCVVPVCVILAACSDGNGASDPTGGAAGIGVNGDLSGIDPTQDSDGDGIPDVDEGSGDADGDGVPAHLDEDEQGTGGTGATGGMAADGGGSGSSGGSGGDGGGGSGDPNVCGLIDVDALAVPPSVMIVQDLSSSLSNQWQPLDDAMTMVVTTFDGRMDMGLIPFPTTYFASPGDPNFNDDSDCSIDDAQVIEPGPNTADDIRGMYDSIVANDMVGGTPTNAALQKALEVLAIKADGSKATPYVILVTDGDPNCAFSNQPGQSSTDADRNGVTDKVKALNDAGIDTYVVGYNFNGSFLDAWADAGGTDSAFRANNTGTLISAIEEIAAGIAPCDYTLDEAVADARYVRVTIDDQGVPVNDPDGWELGDDKKTVTLVGDACQSLRDGNFHSLKVTVECDIVVIQ